MHIYSDTGSSRMAVLIMIAINNIYECIQGKVGNLQKVDLSSR